MTTTTPGRVVLDVEGRTLSADDRRRLMHPATAGVILFAHNFASRAQLRELVAEIHALRSPPMLVMVDHEGGRVQRFRKGFTALPPMAVLGRLWNEDPLGATRAASAVGYVLAGELLECGVDLSLTPVLDLDHGPSGVIGDRAFHRDARVVTLLAKSLMHGMLAAGMANCGKHFPGHGYAVADSHLEVAVDDRDLETLLADDAAPYAWLTGPALAAIMPAHVVYPKVDAKPAGFSRRWLKDVLRGRLGFGGAIFSDDLTMEGAAVAGDIEARTRAAFAAGCDLAVVCNAEQAERSLAVSPPANGATARRIAALAPARPTIDRRMLARCRDEVLALSA